MGVSTLGWMRRVGWWTLVTTCVVYAGFAIAMAGVEVASWVDPAIESKLRALPRLFVVHALSGAIALAAGPFQLHRQLRVKSPAVHRAVGWAYVFSAWTASLTAAGLTPFFDVTWAAKLAFGALAALWFATTTIGLRRAIARRIAEHRAWMLRSFALALFFVTGSLWMEVSRSLPYAQEVTYPLAVFLGWSLNIAVVEGWLRLARRAKPPSDVARPAGLGSFVGTASR